MKYDIIIIGSGPAGITAGIYALRANKKILLLEKEVVGGKISSAPIVENYPGIEQIKGFELSECLEKQIKNLGGAIEKQEVIAINIESEDKIVITKEKKYYSKSVILATGTKYKKLGIKREEEFLGKGISFCATCDGFFYKNKIVAVIGGGNTAIANALELSNICKKVYIIQLLGKLTGEEIMIRQLKNKQNVEILYEASVQEILGENLLKGIVIEQKGKKREILINGMFLSIGQSPETKIVDGQIRMDDKNYIYTDCDLKTSVDGIFAAGDCINKKIRQLTTAVHDGTIAALSAIEYIQNREIEK